MVCHKIAVRIGKEITIFHILKVRNPSITLLIQVIQIVIIPSLEGVSYVFSQTMANINRHSEQVPTISVVSIFGKTCLNLGFVKGKYPFDIQFRLIGVHNCSGVILLQHKLRTLCHATLGNRNSMTFFHHNLVALFRNGVAAPNIVPITARCAFDNLAGRESICRKSITIALQNTEIFALSI